MGWNKDHGTAAKVNADYAKAQGDVAKQEATNLAQLKTDVEVATQNASTAADNANVAKADADNAASEAITQANHAKNEGDRAKAEADRLAGTDVSVLDNKIGSLSSLNTTNKTSVVESVNEVTTQLAQTTTELDSKKADKSYVDTITQSIASGSPKGVYDSLAELENTFPTGNENVYVVKGDGNWYYWNGTAWASGGTYQASELKEDDLYQTMGLPNPVPKTNVTNLAVNGSFEFGEGSPSGWNYLYGNYGGGSSGLTTSDFLVGSKSATISSDGTNTSNNNGRLDQTCTAIVGHKYYVSAHFKTNVAGKAALQIDGKAMQIVNEVNQWVRKTYYFTAESASFIVRLFGTYANANTAVTTYLDGVLIIDLTASFGEGNEPTTQEMDSILTSTLSPVYFDNTLGIPKIGTNNNKVMAVVNNEVKMASFDEFAKATQLPIDDVDNIIGATNTEDALKRLKIGDSYLLKNIIINPLMVGTSDWRPNSVTLTTANNKLIATNTGATATPRIEKRNVDIPKVGDKYKFKIKFTAIDPGITRFHVTVFGLGGGTLTPCAVNNPIVGNEYLFDQEFVVPSNFSGEMSIFYNVTYANTADAQSKKWSLSDAELINMTNVFGAKNEPTITHLESIIKKRNGGLFEGSKVFENFADKLENSTVAFFGTSITGNLEYPKVFQTLSKANTINCGVGGSYITGGSSAERGYFSGVSLIDAYVSGDWTNQESANVSLNLPRYENIRNLDFNKVDFVVFEYATNDYWGRTPLGDKTTDKTTFYGAVNYIIKTLLTKYPHLRIGFVTAMYRSRLEVGDGKDSDTTPNSLGNYLFDYVDAMISACNDNHVPVLDMYKNSGINKYNHALYLSDGLHPNPAGEILMAHKVHKFVETIV